MPWSQFHAPAHTLLHPGPGGRTGCTPIRSAPGAPPKGPGRHGRRPGPSFCSSAGPRPTTSRLPATVSRIWAGSGWTALRRARSTRRGRRTRPHICALTDLPRLRERLMATRGADRAAGRGGAEGVARRGVARAESRTIRACRPDALARAARARAEFTLALELVRLGHETALHRRIQELLLEFSRGISATLSVGAALESLSVETNTSSAHGASSVWLHNRRARELVLAASSEPGYAAAHASVATTSEAIAARGLRLERPQIAAEGQERVLIAPLRGWRRALGTLVIEGGPRDARRPAARRRRVRSGTPAVQHDRERAAARRSPPAAPAAGGHLQLAHRPRRRHRQRPARRPDERSVRGARRQPARQPARTPGRRAHRRRDGPVGRRGRAVRPETGRVVGVRRLSDHRAHEAVHRRAAERHLRRDGDAPHQSGRRAGRPRARGARHHGADPARDESGRRCAAGSRSRRSSPRSGSSSPASRTR